MSAPVGTYNVRAEPSEVVAFCAATRLEKPNMTLPLTFPIRWLVAPAVRDALVAMIPESDLVLVHESQTFDYRLTLRQEEDYVLSLSARREVAPDRLIVDGEIVDTAGELCVTLEAILRLFSTAVAAA